ncbi:hypothetical protein N665_0292s0047 [Sinapis alba]|nr:hypothetical protein N665_0292s0047 [Sinapis alba]
MEPQAPSLNPKLRLLCSYGGRITPTPPSNSLEYIGGETRIVAVPRDIISFSSFFQLLSRKLLPGRSFSLKYRLPGCDLDSLITVTNNDDVENMIAEYDSATPQRIRLFLFPFNHPKSSTRYPLSVNWLLGLESPLQNNDTWAKRVDHGKIHATWDEDTITSASLNVAACGGGSDKETERVEPLQQQQHRQYLPLFYLPVLVSRSVNGGYTLSPAMEYSSGVDPVLENKETAT